MPRGNPATKEPETAEEYLAYAEGMLNTPQSQTTTTTKPREASVGYGEQVNKLLKEVTVSDDGKFVYPDNTPEHLRHAVATEKKYRDTQSGWSRTQQTLKEAEVERDALRNQIVQTSSSTLELSTEEEDRLTTLMYKDPVAWRRELNKLESEHNSQAAQVLDKTMGEVRQKAGAQFELDRRIEVLKGFNEGRQTLVTPEVLDNDIPPRITKKLADGHLTFEGYLAEVDDYLSKGKVVQNAIVDNGTQLSQSAGSNEAPAVDTQLTEGTLDYSSVVF